MEWNYNTDLNNIPACEQWAKMLNETITALRAALAEPEQEPVAWISEGGDVSRSKRYMDEMGFKCEPLYTAPTPRKPQTTHWEGCEAVHPECKKENT